MIGEPQLVAYGYVPAALTSGKRAPNTAGCVAENAGTGITILSGFGSIPVDEREVVINPGDLTAVPVAWGLGSGSDTEIGVQFFRVDTQAHVSVAFSFEIRRMLFR